jgi:hypothetical protein
MVWLLPLLLKIDTDCPVVKPVDALTVTPPVVMLMNFPASVDTTTYALVWLLTGTVLTLPMLSETAVPAVTVVVVVRAAPAVTLPDESRTRLLVALDG